MLTICESKARRSDSIKNEFSLKIHSASSSKRLQRNRLEPNQRKRYFVGIDLHKKFLQIAIMDDTNKYHKKTKWITYTSQLSNILQKHQHLQMLSWNPYQSDMIHISISDR